MVVLRENDEGFPKISNVAPSRLQKWIGSSSWHQRIPDCDHREVKIELCGSWLGRLPYENKCRYRNVHPHSLPAGSHGFVGTARETAAMPPALLEEEKKEERKREKFYIYLDVTHTRTHTHTPGRSRINPERQEEEKSGHKRRAKGQNSAGGEGNERTSRTNLHGETDLTETEHTPKPHDTLRRGPGGKELGTKWGTSWWQEWKNQNN